MSSLVEATLFKGRSYVLFCCCLCFLAEKKLVSESCEKKWLLSFLKEISEKFLLCFSWFLEVFLEKYWFTAAFNSLIFGE